jgi:hypothetical protein
MHAQGRARPDLRSPDGPLLEREHSVAGASRLSLTIASALPGPHGDAIGKATKRGPAIARSYVAKAALSVGPPDPPNLSVSFEVAEALADAFVRARCEGRPECPIAWKAAAKSTGAEVSLTASGPEISQV